MYMNKYTVFRLFWITVFVLLCLGYLLNKNALYVIFIWLFVFVCMVSWASFDMRLQFFIPAFFKGNLQGKNIALTFDDGPTLYTPQVLDLLEKYNYKATFFCIGQQIQQHPNIAKQILSKGHSIANHTYTHTNKMGFLSVNEVISEIEQNQQIIQQTLQITPQWFRPPFGVTNPSIAKAIQQTNLKCIGWNIRSLDTVIQSPTKIVNRLKRKLKPNGIVLMHDTSEKSVIALEQLLKEIKLQQYTVVPLSDLLVQQPYSNEKNN
jgi:peptidoglycan-N-acetylglucosamine deacetylase